MIDTEYEFNRWHSKVKAVAKAYRYQLRRIGYGPIMMRPWFDEGLTPEQGFARFKEIDQTAYREWLAELKQQADKYGIKKSALSKFIKWSTSRYNNYKQSQVVDIAYEMLATGKDSNTDKTIRVFTCGTYTENTGWGYGAYLINGTERYIACGDGTEPQNFKEHNRLQFSDFATKGS